MFHDDHSHSERRQGMFACCSVRTPPGTKIQVKNATISQNRLILIEKGSEVVNLGGTVEELQQTWETNKVRRHSFHFTDVDTKQALLLF